MARRYALLIADSEYEDPAIRNLKTPPRNLEMLKEVLVDPEIGNFAPSDVTSLLNKPLEDVKDAISDFFSNKKIKDLLFLYFTGHGYRGKQTDDHLYLAVKDTKMESKNATTVSDAFISREIAQCRAQKQVIILDCCYSGGFKATGDAPPGASVVVLTASDKNEFAWESETDDADIENSLYTRHLIQGLKSGEADRDGDGWVTLSELHTWLRNKHSASKQNPLKLHPFSREETDIRFAKNPVARMVHDARQRELNKAYSEAIHTWEEILIRNPNHPEAHTAIQRLKDQSGRADIVKKLLHKLPLRAAELTNIYLDLAGYLKRLEKEGIGDDDEIFLNVFKTYLSGDLHAEDFIKLWKKMTKKVATKQPGPNFGALVQRLERGEVIPFFGSETIHSTEPPIPAYAEVVRQLSENAEYSDYNGLCLPMIAQYYQMTEYGRRTLIDKYRKAALPECGEFQACRFYAFLSKIKHPIIVISTSYGNHLEQTFQKSGKKFILLTHTIPAPGEKESGSPFVVWYSDKKAPEPPCAEDNISSIAPIENGYSIVYKIRGAFSLYKSKDAIDTLMITDDDYFSFTKHTKKLFPSYLGTQLKRRSLLFLGYNLKQWHDRLIASSILERRRLQRERFYTVNANPTQYEGAFWKYNGVDILSIEFDAFIKNLIQASGT